MEDQRAEEIWWQNEIRSGRDPSKGCGCPMDRDTFENVKLLAPILFLLFGVTVLFAVVAGVLYDLAGYAVKIPGLILISLFVMAMIIYALWPLILHKNEQTFEKDQIELAKTYSISEYFDRTEQTALDILEHQEPIDKTIILWWGLDGLRLNEDGTTEWVRRKKENPFSENVVYQPLQNIQPIQTGNLLFEQMQCTKEKIDALMAQNTICVQSKGYYTPYYYAGCCCNFMG